VAVEALEERLRLRLRLLLTWKARAVELSRHPETCSEEEWPSHVSPSCRIDWLREQQERAQSALEHFRDTLRQRAIRFADLARVYAYRRDRLPEKVAEGRLSPDQANVEARQLLRAIEASARCARICEELARADTLDAAGGPIKVRLCRYETELERFGSLNVLLDTLETGISHPETSPAPAAVNPPSASAPSPKKTFRLAPRPAGPGVSRQHLFNLSRGDLLVLGAMAVTLLLLGSVVSWYYVFSLNLRVEISPIPDHGIRLVCANWGIRPVRIVIPDNPSWNRQADARVRFRRSAPDSATEDQEVAGNWRSLDLAGAGPLWTIPPLGSGTWDFLPKDPSFHSGDLRLEVLSSRNRVLFSQPVP